MRRGMAVLLTALLFVPEMDRLASLQGAVSSPQQGELPRLMLPGPFVDHYRFPCRVEAAVPAAVRQPCTGSEDRHRKVIPSHLCPQTASAPACHTAWHGHHHSMHSPLSMQVLLILEQQTLLTQAAEVADLPGILCQTPGEQCSEFDTPRPSQHQSITHGEVTFAGSEQLSSAVLQHYARVLAELHLPGAAQKGLEAVHSASSHSACGQALQHLQLMCCTRQASLMAPAPGGRLRA